MTEVLLERVVITLVEPQSVDNVGAALRVMRNMGLSQLRLVQPAPFDWARLPVIAHRSQVQAAAIRVYDDLLTAIADTVYVVGCTARSRATQRPVLSPTEAARRAIARSQSGLVALLFGREDTGLPNMAVDHCHALLTIPTDPAYPSLNLAQAVAIVAYELRLAASTFNSERSTVTPTKEGSGLPDLGGPDVSQSLDMTTSKQRPTSAETEAMFAALADALIATDFLIPSRAEATLRALRALILRAEPTVEETALLTALARAIRHRA